MTPHLDYHDGKTVLSMALQVKNKINPGGRQYARHLMKAIRVLSNEGSGEDS